MKVIGFNEMYFLIIFYIKKTTIKSKCVCLLFFFCFLTGGGLPHLTRRGGSEVCVVVSGQHQGQVYLCDTANLGSSAHS